MIPLPPNPNDSELLASEQSDLEAETRWLLNEEFDGLVAELNREFDCFGSERIRSVFYAQPRVHAVVLRLNTCFAYIAEDDAGKCAGETLALTTKSSEVLKGYVTLCGPQLTKGEIMATMPKHARGYPTHTIISAQQPYPMPQIADLKESIQVLRVVTESLAKPDSLDQGKEAARCLLDHLNNTMAILKPKEELLFPKQPSYEDSFEPALVDTLSIGFHLDADNLIAEVRALKFHATPPVRYRSLIHGWVEPPQVHTYNGRLAEVLDSIVVVSTVPSLKAIWASLCASHALSSAYREKLIAVQEAGR
ncbi:Rogdi leucine zipper containing protein-domain-containing protein [Thamnocephalis sphaerospora]|uniref:Rogdi leucine zipper containing protein-domain-containing protein n=1 Tax=Thamnocephalis sphaerospora TaxID=78915 RepID=A0A4V1IX91_9FUNG|nr:Rogdi leucine zipper containing protein-domain-containing protein [Thamnocephalis sphaerospora]|eukprot:RKP10239.1 Rogdi leucine zipper containing protein-domain-containing protein [Thamnocephalis sphaerospora]